MKTHELTDEERRMMRHAVGADAKRGLQGYRNRYSAPKGSDAERSWLGLVARGLARGAGELPGGLIMFDVTRSGCAALGLGKAATVRACGTESEQAALHQRKATRRVARQSAACRKAIREADAAIRQARRAVDHARRAIETASRNGAPDAAIARIARKLDKAVSQ